MNWKSEDLSILRKVENNKKIIKNKTTLYTHHFVVNITHDDLPSIGSSVYIELVFNVISNNATPYAKLEELDGDGYIINAFGLFRNVNTHEPTLSVIWECKLFYKDLNNGTLLLNYNDTSLQSVKCVVVGGFNNYQLEDGVQKI